MKQTLSIVFLIVFFLKIGGYYAYLTIEKSLAKEVMEQTMSRELPKSSLTCIVANEQNLAKITWEEPEKEFSLEGNLYDVVLTETHNGITYYYCLNDYTETQIEQQIDRLLNHQDQLPLNQSAKALFTLLFEPITNQALNTFNFAFSSAFKTHIFPPFAQVSLRSFVPKIEHPPRG